MKNFALILIFVFSYAGVSGQSNIKKILENMNAQQTAWNNGDIDGFMIYYWKSDSLKFIGKKGITYGWQSTIENYKRSYPDKASMGILKFTILEATPLSDDAVYVIGKWELQKEKPVSGHFTLLWRKINDQWVIVSDHTS
jgi:ketosteroid isomerase-like protein